MFLTWLTNKSPDRSVFETDKSSGYDYNYYKDREKKERKKKKENIRRNK